jgi:hypothetical protein
MAYTWEELYDPKPTKEQRTPITVGCTVGYASPSLWGWRYVFTVIRIEGRRVWVRHHDGKETEDYDANLRVMVDGRMCVNTTDYTDWEQHYDAARKRFEDSNR